MDQRREAYEAVEARRWCQPFQPAGSPFAPLGSVSERSSINRCHSPPSRSGVRPLGITKLAHSSGPTAAHSRNVITERVLELLERGPGTRWGRRLDEAGGGSCVAIRNLSRRSCSDAIKPRKDGPIPPALASC
jgi:hypothetical protein